jgi:hypothetical protein
MASRLLNVHHRVQFNHILGMVIPELGGFFVTESVPRGRCGLQTTVAHVRGRSDKFDCGLSAPRARREVIHGLLLALKVPEGNKPNLGAC